MLNTVKDALKNVLIDDEGATLVEYGLIVALVAAICIAIVATLGTQIKAAFSTVSGNLTTAGVTAPSN